MDDKKVTCRADLYCESERELDTLTSEQLAEAILEEDGSAEIFIDRDYIKIM